MAGVAHSVVGKARDLDLALTLISCCVTYNISTHLRAFLIYKGKRLDWMTTGIFTAMTVHSTLYDYPERNHVGFMVPLCS